VAELEARVRSLEERLKELEEWKVLVDAVLRKANISPYSW